VLLFVAMQVFGTIADHTMLEKLNAAAAAKVADTVKNGQVGGKRWQGIMKSGEMPKMHISKNSYVPNELTKVPEGWRLGKLDEVKESQQKFHDNARHYFENDAARIEKQATTSGVNRQAFLGNSVKTDAFPAGFVNALKTMAGKWTGLLKKGVVARVNHDDKGKPHATHDKIDNKRVFGIAKPIGARRLLQN